MRVVCRHMQGACGWGELSGALEREHEMEAKIPGRPDGGTVSTTDPPRHRLRRWTMDVFVALQTSRYSRPVRVAKWRRGLGKW